MKLIKRLISIVILVLSPLILCARVFAHPGSTDVNGGHYDHSTGEYHYHHGYPAHSHTDVNGDGVLDCPYNFDDQTDHDYHGGDSSNWENTYNNENSSNEIYYPTSTSPEVPTQTVIEEEPVVPKWVYWVFAGLIFIIFILFLLNRNKKEELRNMETVHLAEIRAIRQDCEEQLRLHHATASEIEILNYKVESLRKTNKSLLDQIETETRELERIKTLRSRMNGAPLDITFTSSGKPIFHKPDPWKPYGDYTVFTNAQTNIYHTDRLCASYRAKTSHIFDIIDDMRACKKCATGRFSFTHAPDWYTDLD